MKETDAYYSVYICVGLICLTAILGSTFYGATEYTGHSMTKKQITCLNGFSIVFPVIVVLSNYSMFTPIREHVIKLLFVLSSSYFVGRSILIWMSIHIGRYNTRDAQKKGKPSRLFLISVSAFTFIYITFLITVVYPGVLTVDSMSQIYQALNKITSNHHPFYHTLMIRYVLRVGLLFGDVNLAVALYSILQLLIMAAIFAYVMMTLYQMNASRIMLLLSMLIYSVIPYHIVYSVTMWKDVIFGGAVVLFVTSIIRLYRDIGREITSYIMLTIGGALFALFRSNGWAALLVTFIVVLMIFRTRKIFVLMTVILVGTFILKHPVLEVLGVSQPDIVEALSIPEQQVARLVADGVEIPQEDLSMIGKVADLETLADDYNPHISDPVKLNIREHGGADYLEAHKTTYLLLWLRLGLRYPQLYIKSWVDQTKGFWSGGYKYWIWHVDIAKTFTIFNGKEIERNQNADQLHIYQCPQNGILSRIYTWWLTCFENESVFEPFRSIGLHVWVFLFAFIVAFVRKKKEIILVSTPVLAIILTLMLTTPVYSEFRYAYAVFTVFPLLIVSFLTCREGKSELVSYES